MQNIALITGGIFGALSIMLGAFGSHLLKKKWEKDVLDSFEIGVKYQMYHALFLLLLGFNDVSNTCIYLTVIGVLLFSGSIYGICILKSRKLPVKFLGPITPIGGICLLLAWIFFLISATQHGA